MAKENKNKVNIHEEYLLYYERFLKKYNNKIIVLMQVGSFHEAYSTEKRGPNLYELSELLNIACTRKDKSIDIINEKNPYMMGFPSVALSKYLKTLIDNNYTVIVIDQTTPPPNPSREITGIYSSSTYIDNISYDNKYLMAIYIEINNSINNSKNNISIGLSTVDCSTGDIYYYEAHSMGIVDENEALNEAQRFYHYYRPVELLLYIIDNTTKCDDYIKLNNKIINKLDILSNQIIFTYNKINPNFTKLSYQNTLLSKIYNNCGIIGPIDFFNLGKLPYTIITLIICFDYIFQHNENLIKNLKNPCYFNEHKYMILVNNAQYQLNIINYHNLNNTSKYQSLDDVVNNCCSCMGKRYLKHRLCAPYTDINIITNIYDLTEKILNLDYTDELRKYLRGIYDLDKLFRKISIKVIKPSELYLIYESFTNIIEIINLLLHSNFKKDLYKMFSKNNIKLFNDSISFLENTFFIEKLKIYNNLIDIKESFYVKNVHTDIDKIEDKISKGIGFIEKLAKAIEQHDNSITLYIKHNDRDGYYLSTTKQRGLKLQNIFKKNIKIQLENLDTFISSDDLLFTYNINTCKISYKELITCSDEIDNLYDELTDKIKLYFHNDIINWYDDKIEMIKSLILMITNIDLLCNNAYTSKKFHYVKPIINNSYTSSYINVTQLRHPIIERLIEYEYTPHDIILDDNITGNLIYGVNSCGKSSLMKAVGTSIIMAQCGLYVPADRFEYNIFESLYTRISGNDNLFRGQSSFIIEMNELRTILKNSNNRSLVIGDEICRGTEYLSANAIVGASILNLINNNVKFLFATHLHELMSIDNIKKLTNLKLFHLAVEKNGDELIFNRKLIEGTGEQVYGITIAKYILDDPIFMNLAIELKNELLEKKNINCKLVNDKKSNYNNDIYMNECFLCKSSDKLETHHINQQKDFINTKNGLINENKKFLLKNSQSNLLVLCDKCHDNLHSKKIQLSSLLKSTNGFAFSSI